MAAPLAVAAKAIGKKIATDILFEPENLLKYIFIILGIIFGIASLLVLPAILLTHLPSLLLSSGDKNINQDKIAIYESIPNQYSIKITDWIAQKKKEFKDYDTIVVNNSFGLSWRELMAIDAVKLNQDFSKAKASNVLSIADKFIVTSTTKDTYKVRESGTTTINGISYITHHWVTKKRVTINITTKPLNDVMSELGFNDEDKEIANNMYSFISTLNLEGSQNIYDNTFIGDLQEYPPGDSKIPLFYQHDKRWAYESYGSTTIMEGGCGPTSLSMVVAGLTGSSDINPKAIADWSVANGHRAEGAGSYWSLMTAGGEYFGLKVEAISRQNSSKIASELSKGNPIIVSMGPGDFTKGGHFIVLRGIKKNMVSVNDPASYTRSNKEWPLSTIISQSSTNGGVSGSPFWVFKLK